MQDIHLLRKSGVVEDMTVRAVLEFTLVEYGFRAILSKHRPIGHLINYTNLWKQTWIFSQEMKTVKENALQKMSYRLRAILFIYHYCVLRGFDVSQPYSTNFLVGISRLTRVERFAGSVFAGGTNRNNFFQ